jgi:hypothetical protein
MVTLIVMGMCLVLERGDQILSNEIQDYAAGCQNVRNLEKNFKISGCKSVKIPVLSNINPVVFSS